VVRVKTKTKNADLTTKSIPEIKFIKQYQISKIKPCKYNLRNNIKTKVVKL